jgi:hypothetical protein
MKSIVLFAISIAAAAVGLAIWPGALKAGGPVINSFVAVPDCILPDPRRGILSYRVSGGIMRIRLYAVHHGGRVREFHSQSSGLTPALSMAASNVIDPGAASDIESYVLRVTGEAGAEVRGVVSFRYRRAVFDLVPPAFHTRVTTGSGRLALYQSPATIANVDSLSCSFKFDARLMVSPAEEDVRPLYERPIRTPFVAKSGGAACERRTRPAPLSGQHG